MIRGLRRRMLLNTAPAEHIIGPAYFEFTASGTLDLSPYNFVPGDTATIICIGYGGGQGGAKGATSTGVPTPGGGGGNGGNGYGGGNGGNGGDGGSQGKNGGNAGEYIKQTLIITSNILTITINNTKTQCDTITARALYLTGGGTGGASGQFNGGGGGGAGAPGWNIDYETKTANRAQAWNPNNGSKGSSQTGGKGAPNNTEAGQNGNKNGAAICIIWPDY